MYGESQSRGARDEEGTENIPSTVDSFIQAHVSNPRVFGNDSVIRDVLYQSQLGQNSRFCPVLMPVKKGRLKDPFLHQFLKKNVTDFETINSK